MESGSKAVNRQHSKLVDHWWQRALQRLLPRHCALCQQAALPQLDLCSPCRADLPWLESCCPICAEPLAENTPCGSCLCTPPDYDQSLIPLYYETPVDRWLVQFKFHRTLAYGRLLSRILAEMVWHADQPPPAALIPVPLHRQRLRQRGFNQAALIARDLGRWLRLPVLERQLVRREATIAQSALSRAQREQNLLNAFSVRGPVPASVALIDDVVTTTSTVRACATALRQAGVQQVSVWALARTP